MWLGSLVNRVLAQCARGSRCESRLGRAFSSPVTDRKSKKENRNSSKQSSHARIMPDSSPVKYESIGRVFQLYFVGLVSKVETV